jgi:hypothetical protein
MAPDRQIAANRENAKRSTGPRSEAGKARSARNALKHGLSAEHVVMLGEDLTESLTSNPRVRERHRPGAKTF